MNISEMEAKARQLKQLNALIDEAIAETTVIKADLKAAMGDAETVWAGEYRITWKTVTMSRLDVAALRKAMPDLVAAFTRETTTHRFIVT